MRAARMVHRRWVHMLRMHFAQCIYHAFDRVRGSDSISMPANKKQFYAILLNISAIYSHLFLLFGVRTNFRAMIAYAPQPEIVASCIISLLPFGWSFFLSSTGRPSKCNASPIGVKLECHTKTLRSPVDCRCLLFDWLWLAAHGSETCCKHPIVHPVGYLFPLRTLSFVGLTNRLANRGRECDAVVHVICLSIRYSRRAHHFSHSFRSHLIFYTFANAEPTTT